MPVTSGTTYLASYHTTTGHYSVTGKGSAPEFDNSRCMRWRRGRGSNGVYLYGTSGFPNQTFNAANYGVDVSFDVSGGVTAVPSAPTGVTATAQNSSAIVSWTAPANNGSPITSYTVTPFLGAVPAASTVIRERHRPRRRRSRV